MQEPSPEITDQQLLAALLTTEGLLFAALTITVSLTASSTFGRRHVISPKLLAGATVLVLTVVAVAAGLAWCDLFAGSEWPSSTGGRVQAVSLLVAIGAQPLFALALAINVWKG